MDSVTTAEPGRLEAELKDLLDRSLAGDPAARIAAAGAVRGQNPIDLARLLGGFGDEHVRHAFDLLDQERRAIVLAEADPKVQALLLMHVGDRGVADLLAELEPDDAADVLLAIEAPAREKILESLEAEEAREIRELGRYGAETAGGLMTTSYVDVPPSATQQEIIRRIRSNEDAETINVIYVTDQRKLLGVMSIRDVLLSPPLAPASEVMTTEVIAVKPQVPQEEVIRVMETYHLNALPVVDESAQLLGIVTSDDVMTALEDEASKDVMALAGSSERFSMRQTIWERVRGRVPWLLVTLAGGLLASVVIRTLGAWFGNLEAVGVVGRFLPLVAGLAGNVAIQSAAVMVRGFATGEIQGLSLPRLILEEVAVGALVGSICGVAAGLIAAIMGVAAALCLSIGISIACATTLAGGSGTIVPAICARLGIDPAISAGPFITTLNDILGFTIYMVVALTLVGQFAT